MLMGSQSEQTVMHWHRRVANIETYSLVLCGAAIDVDGRITAVQAPPFGVYASCSYTVRFCLDAVSVFFLVFISLLLRIPFFVRAGQVCAVFGRAQRDLWAVDKINTPSSRSGAQFEHFFPVFSI